MTSWHGRPMGVLFCLNITLLNYHHYAGLLLFRYTLSSVCLRLSRFSQLSYMQYMGLRVFGLPIYLMMIARIRVLHLDIIIKSEVWPICLCLGLGHETLVCAVCLSVFLWKRFPYWWPFVKGITVMKERTFFIIQYNDVIMGTMASQITSLTIVYSTVYSGTDQRKHQSSASLAFVRGIHRSPVNSTHKGPVTRKMFPFDDVIMIIGIYSCKSQQELMSSWCQISHTLSCWSLRNIWGSTKLHSCWELVQMVQQWMPDRVTVAACSRSLLSFGINGTGACIINIDKRNQDGI